MKVLINGRYAYETDLEDVEIGDEMVLPGTLSSDLWSGIVTALEPEYDGPCRKAMGLYRRRAQVEAGQKALAEVKIEGWKVGDTFSKPCGGCGRGRLYSVEEINRVGRPTSVGTKACDCGDPPMGSHFGSAAGFRHFMIESSL